MGNCSPNHISLCIFGILILTGYIFTLASPNWVHTAKTSVSNVQQEVEVTRGLWFECTYLLSTGTGQCSEIAPSAQISKLPKYLGYARVGMILATILVFFATITAILGNPCLKCCRVKSKMITWITAGTFFLSGVLSLIAYSWYTNAAMNNYVKKTGGAKPQGRVGLSQWDLGWAMWLGFCNSIFAIIGSLHAAYTAASINDEVFEDYGYNSGEQTTFKPASYNTEYV